jgi:hypothetical protein
MKTPNKQPLKLRPKKVQQPPSPMAQQQAGANPLAGTPMSAAMQLYGGPKLATQ